MYTLNQHEFVEGCLRYYAENYYEPGNSEDGIWHRAHYPVPKCLGGKSTILLLAQHHAVQGVLQSLEYETCCVGCWEGDYLSGQWEYLQPVYKAFKSILGVKNAERLNKEKTPDGKSVNAVKGGRASRESGEGALCRTAEQMSEDGRIGGTITKAKGLGIFAPGQQSAGGSVAARQRWQCTVTGKVSAAGPLTGWQKARGIDVSNRVRRYDLE